MNKTEIEQQIATLQETLKKITIKEQLDSLGLTKEQILEVLGVTPVQTHVTNVVPQSEYVHDFKPYTTVIPGNTCTNIKTYVNISCIQDERLYKLFVKVYVEFGHNWKMSTFRILLGHETTNGVNPHSGADSSLRVMNVNTFICMFGYKDKVDIIIENVRKYCDSRNDGTNGMVAFLNRL